MNVLLTGSEGFIGSYICDELLDAGYTVLGIDNFSKYGKVKRAHIDHPRFHLIEGSVQDINRLVDEDLVIDYFIAGAALIGGIGYFHKYAYDLISVNERILAASYDFIIRNSLLTGKFKRVIMLSSSMVFENTSNYPTRETDLLTCPPPSSTYGFQKLSCEYFAKGAYQQYKIPYTIIRPFNCVGVGENECKDFNFDVIENVKVAMSHVVPDLISRVLDNSGSDPLSILGKNDQVRCYTHGSDIARGIRLAMESDSAVNNDFNISSDESITVIDLAKLIWTKIHGDLPIKFTHLTPYEHDVQKRIPCTDKACELLNFKCSKTLTDSIDEVIQWMKQYKKL
jgi:nucleoside-diphosphate-sugar epimerase